MLVVKSGCQEVILFDDDALRLLQSAQSLTNLYFLMQC